MLEETKNLVVVQRENLEKDTEDEITTRLHNLKQIEEMTGTETIDFERRPIF